MNGLIILLLLLFSLGLGGIIVYFILRPQIKHTVERNTAIEIENNSLQEKNEELKTQSKILEKKTEEIRQQAIDAKWEYNALQARRDEIKTSLDDLEKQSEDAAKKFYSSALEVAQNSFDKEIDNINKKLDDEREEAKKEYLKTLKECLDDFLHQISQKSQELLTLNIMIAHEQENVDAAVAAAKRRELITNQKDFYRINLSDEDILEIKRLREVLPYLRDKTSLNKVIYKVYYEKPLTDMIGRVIGSGIHTGIYKITNLSNKKCYVGQSVNIADRWRQHVKRGVGAEDWTRNKLYPAMYSLGIENFTFEIIEECERSKLNEREKYWTEFFHAQDFGYSIRSG